MREFRVVALDLDGTLLTTDKRVTDRSRDALAALDAQGVRIALVTGRNLPMARKAAEALPFNAVIVAHNGALVADAQNGTVRSGQFLPRATAIRLSRAFREWACAPFLYTSEDGHYFLRHDASGANPAQARYLDANRMVCASVADVEAWLSASETAQVLHVVAIEREERVRRALGAIAPIEDARLLTSGALYGGEYWFLEAIHPAASKVGALAALCRDWGISFSDVLAIGDNLNDVELLQAAGFGVAMGNAPAEVKAAARMVTRSNDEEGVAEALATLFGSG